MFKILEELRVLKLWLEASSKRGGKTCSWLPSQVFSSRLQNEDDPDGLKANALADARPDEIKAPVVFCWSCCALLWLGVCVCIS